MLLGKISKALLALGAVVTVSACSTARFGSDTNDENLVFSARGPIEILNDTRFPHPPTKTKIPSSLPQGVYPTE